MSIRCPNPGCQFLLELKGAKPGRFAPRCPSCGEKFVLLIPAEAGAPAQVTRIPQTPHAKDALHESLPDAVAGALGIDPPKPAPRAPNVPVPQRPASMMQTAPPQASLSSLDASRSQHAADSRPAASSVHAPCQAVGETSIPAHGAGAPRANQTSVPNQDAIDAQDLTAMPAAAGPALEGKRLGGYEVLRKLGQGGMGAVYLARQVSLDRNVALKVLAPQLAGDPQFVARFTREAYAAAQLTHHNVVQIHDIGQQKMDGAAGSDVNFFSMEFVEGRNLADVVHDNGRIDPETAVGHALQAARGLKYAHDHALIHRDIKPENLLLNEQGLVKVADLGLVKRAGSDDAPLTVSPGEQRAQSHEAHSGSTGATQLNVSMGTPAYMPPEQATDAAHVDHRADIYSLGCTLYDLLVGRPPFEGRTALEVITKHQREQLVPPDRIVKNVPRMLSEIILKMTAKRPDDRYGSMGDVIRALEDFLGVETTGANAVTARPEHVKVLEFAAERFNKSTWAKLRTQMLWGFLFIVAAATIALAALGHPILGGGILGMGVLSTFAYQITLGVVRRTTLFDRFRQWAFGANILDWLLVLLGLAALVGMLWAFEWLTVWLVGAALAVLLSQAFFWTMDQFASREQAPPILQTRTLLKQLRGRGLDEDAVRKFVARHAGDNWEAFYEELFGYEDKLRARSLWGKGETGRLRRRHAAWRDPVIRWLDSKLKARKEARERRILARIEAKALGAKGINQKLARKQALRAADKVMARAEQVKADAIKRLAELDEREKRIAKTAATAAAKATAPPPPSAKTTALPGATALPSTASNAAAAAAAAGAKPHPTPHDEEEEARVHESYVKRRFGGPLDILLAGQIRFVIAVLLLAVFSVWWHQNKLTSVAQQAEQVAARHREIDVTNKFAITDTIKEGKQVDLNAGTERDVDLSFVPEKFRHLLSGYNVGLAGLLLLLSVLFRGKMLAVLIIVASAIALVAPHMTVPVLGQVSLLIACCASMALWLLAVIFFRETGEW